MLPDPTGQSVETALPRQISPLDYEFILPRYSQYLSDMHLMCHGLVIDTNQYYAQLRLSLNDIESVTLCLDGQPLISLYSMVKEEPIVQQIMPTYSYEVDFFEGWPLITEALYKVTPTLRVRFWREPVSPFWLQFTVYSTLPCWHSDLQQNAITVPRSDNAGTFTYSEGVIWSS